MIDGTVAALELGGHNPLIAMPDADLGRAVEAAYAGAFWSAGQKCTAKRRIFVHDSVYEEFRRRLLERIEQGRVGDPSDAEVEVGPVVTETALGEIQQTAGADVHVPFGGIKGSGYGPHEQGRAALEFYTEVVTVYQDV